MSIFKNLENLSVSEECFYSIIGTIKSLINELYDETMISSNKKRMDNLCKAYLSGRSLGRKYNNEVDKSKKERMKTEIISADQNLKNAERKFMKNTELVKKRMHDPQNIGGPEKYQKAKLAATHYQDNENMAKER